MRNTLQLATRCLALAGSLLLVATFVYARPRPLPPADPMREAVVRFLSTLDDAGRGRAMMAFESEERFNWHFVPRERLGLPLEEMTLAQRSAAHDLLRAALSDRGYLKATGVFFVESVLRALEDGNPGRNPERYYLTVFGDPAAEEPWGWRLEGHHLSLNYTSAGGGLAVTPAFIGSNPARVPSGPYAGYRLLGEEEDLGRALLAALTPAQRTRAVLSAEAPEEIVTGASRRAELEQFEGIPVSEMTEAQRGLLLRLLESYTGNMSREVARAQMEQIEAAGVDRLYFAWAGSAEPGAAHYYRIHGPTLLIEYDNSQNDANHVHTVWRDLRNDFGEDLLRAHYERHQH